MLVSHDPSLQHRQLLPIVSGILGTNPPVSPIISIPSLTLLSTPTSTTSSTLSSTSTVSTSTSTSTSTSSTPTTPSTTAVPSTTSSTVHVTTSGGRTITVVVDPTTSPSPMANSFLESKTAQGVVFALVGIVVLVLVIVFATFILRRRSRRHLTEEAISFDPGVINAERGSMEKASIRSSGSVRSYHRPYYLPGTNALQYPRP